jgi:hypothetical protein
MFGVLKVQHRRCKERKTSRRHHLPLVLPISILSVVEYILYIYIYTPTTGFTDDRLFFGLLLSAGVTAQK